MEYHCSYYAFYCRYCGGWIEERKEVKIQLDVPLHKKKSLHMIGL